MPKITIFEWAKLIGFLLIVVATVISIVWMPVVDNQIEREAAYVNKYTDRRTVGLGIMLHNGQLDTQRMINFLETKLIASGIGKQDRIDAIGKSILSKTQMMLKTWAGLFAESKEWERRVDKEINLIMHDDSLSEQEKFNRLDKIRDEERDAAIKRVNESESRRKEHRNRVQKLESKKDAWYSGFCLLQIVGLILLSGGEIVEKVVRQRQPKI